jgi:hypothetical protein
MGISVTRNREIKVARGKYITLTRNEESRIKIRKEKVNAADHRIKAKN